MTRAERAAEPTKAHLREQIRRLERVVSHGMSYEATQALRLLKMARGYLRDLNTAPLGYEQIAGLIGPNGGSLSTHAVNSLCRGVEGFNLTAIKHGFVVDDERFAA